MTKGDLVEGSAFVPEEPAPVTKKYRVLGGRNVLGWEPNDTFSQPISENQERRLIERGQLEIVGEERIEETGQPVDLSVTESGDANNQGVGDPEAGQER